jgi:hypothetical protein
MGGGEIDAAGTLLAGSLVATEIDGAAPRSGPHSTTCPNCSAPVAGNFCSACGQSAHLPRSIGHILHDLLHGVLHFDSKGWRTLPMLVFRPGRLTRDYVEGRRARYVAPFAMFLFTVFVMYFTFAFIGGDDAVKLDDVVQMDAASVADVEAELRTAEAELARLEAEQRAIAAKPVKAPGEGAGLGGEIAGRRAVIAALRAGLRHAEQTAGKPGGTEPDGASASFGDELAAAAKAEGLDIDLGNDALNARAREALANPDLLFYKMQQSAYKFSFLLVPLSLPFVWLLFPFRRGTYLYDHAVFTLYSLSFVSLLFVAAALLTRIGLIGSDTAVLLCLVLPPVHMFVQLKGAYRLGVLGALVRTLLLGAFAIVALSLFFVIVVLLGVA